MKVTYQGTGAVFVESVGQVAHGETVEMPEALGAVLIRENPTDWKEATAPSPDRPRAKREITAGGE